MTTEAPSPRLAIRGAQAANVCFVGTATRKDGVTRGREIDVRATLAAVTASAALPKKILL
jgi:hypothetical protein